MAYCAGRRGLSGHHGMRHGLLLLSKRLVPDLRWCRPKLLFSEPFRLGHCRVWWIACSMSNVLRGHTLEALLALVGSHWQSYSLYTTNTYTTNIGS